MENSTLRRVYFDTGDWYERGILYPPEGEFGKNSWNAEILRIRGEFILRTKDKEKGEEIPLPDKFLAKHLTRYLLRALKDGMRADGTNIFGRPEDFAGKGQLFREKMNGYNPNRYLRDSSYWEDDVIWKDSGLTLDDVRIRKIVRIREEKVNWYPRDYRPGDEIIRLRPLDSEFRDELEKRGVGIIRSHSSIPYKTGRDSETGAERWTDVKGEWGFELRAGDIRKPGKRPVEDLMEDPVEDLLPYSFFQNHLFYHLARVFRLGKEAFGRPEDLPGKEELICRKMKESFREQADPGDYGWAGNIIWQRSGFTLEAVRIYSFFCDGKEYCLSSDGRRIWK